MEEPLLEVLWGGRTDLLEKTAIRSRRCSRWSMRWRNVEELGNRAGSGAGAQRGRVRGGVRGGSVQPGGRIEVDARRGRLMQKVMGRGAMAAVMAGEERVREALKGLEERVSIAGLNAPESVVISGYEEEVGIAEEAEARRECGYSGWRCRTDSIRRRWRRWKRSLRRWQMGIKYAVPRVKLISSVTGKEVGQGKSREAVLAAAGAGAGAIPAGDGDARSEGSGYMWKWVREGR